MASYDSIFALSKVSASPIGFGTSVYGTTISFVSLTLTNPRLGTSVNFSSNDNLPSHAFPELSPCPVIVQSACILSIKAEPPVTDNRT